MQAWHVERYFWDQAYAEYSIDGGAWQEMWQNPNVTDQSNWTNLTYDITDAAGKTLQLRWRLITDASIVYAGIYVDDIVIR